MWLYQAKYRVHLPLVARTWAPDWEQEPNDTAAQANGPAVSGRTYHGTMPAGDVNDYFYFDLPTSGSVDLWLTRIPSGCDYVLVLRNAALSMVGYSGKVGGADEHVGVSGLPPGRYYIQVYHRSTVGSSQPYDLRAVYP